MQNVDKIRQTDGTSNTETVNHESGNVIHVEYTPHVMSRLNHTKEDGTPESNSVPNRRVGKTGQLLPWSSVKVHIRKIVDHVASGKESNLPKRVGDMSKVAFIHKPTGHKIITHITKNKDGSHHIRLATYLDHNQPVDNIGKFDPRAPKNKPGTVSLLEMIRGMVQEKIIDNQEVTIVVV